MFIEILVAIILGVHAGIITGLIPGVHINLISVITVTLSPFLLQHTNVLSLVLFIISMSITHTFLDFIPSIFLGVPDGDTALSILPGHKMVLEGYAYEAVRLTVIGSLLSIICSVVIFPLLIIIVPYVYEGIRIYIGWILILAVAFLIYREKDNNSRFWAFFVFMISGIFGYLVFDLHNLSEPLLPMLSGLFGLSMIINSLFEKTVIPKQRVTDNIEIDNKTLAKALGAGTAAGSLTGFFPGLGGAQASVIGSLLVGGIDAIGTYGYMILQGGINTVNFLISLVTLYTLEKARNGAIIAVLKLVETLPLSYLLIILSSSLIVGGCATFLAMYFARTFSKIMERVNYAFLCYAIILLILVLVFVMSGFLGLFILLVSTMIGFIPISLGIGKNHSMGCILFPVILYFVL